MQAYRKLATAAGIAGAPWIWMAGRALGWQRLNALALHADPQFMRAIHANQNGMQLAQVVRFRLAALLSAEARPEQAQRIAELFSFSQSQVLQDLFALLAVGERHGGYFVEVGVGSGKEISNTYMLEKQFGWNGILVEPNKSSHASIRECRSAQLECRAAGSQSGKVLTFREMVGAGEYSSIAGTGGPNMPGVEVLEYGVESVTLNEVLAQNGAPAQIDYLSLDTEGSEIDILNGLDLDRYAFKVMTIEHNGNQKTQATLKQMLEPRGYHRVFPHISDYDAWYIHDSIRATAFRNG
jgi:FkbM family methyltransferase